MAENPDKIEEASEFDPRNEEESENLKKQE